MFSKILSAFLVIVLLAGSMSVFSAGAVETEKSTDLAQVKTIKLEVKNNIATYTDDNGKEVDVSSGIPKRKARTALPSSYDLREHGRSTDVKNQGAYGLCWSFASTASMESSILTKVLSNETSDTLDLSEAGNSWYFRTNTEDISSPLYNDYLDDPSKGAQGGYSGYVADSISSGYGAYPESLVSYDDFKNGYSDALRFYSDYRLKEYTELDYDIDLIKQRIMDTGAVYYSYNSFSENYFITEDGVETYYDNGTSIDGYEPNGGHAVTVVGWDDNFSKDNFNPELNIENDGAWLCKNSWGEDYQQNKAKGYEGYFWASYESDVNLVSQFEMQDADSFDNVYQHQVTGNIFVYSDCVANVFTAKSNEKLEQICFSNIGQVNANIKVYKLDKNYTSPVDGELLTEFSSSVDYSGTHCVDCPKDIVFNEGDVFSVVVEGEGLISKFKEQTYYDSEITGKSYFTTDDNNWADTAQDETGEISYAAIKACTSSASVDKSKLSKLVEEAKSFEPFKETEQNKVDELKDLIATAEKVLRDENATNNEVSNTYCILNARYDSLKNYNFYINNLEDFLEFYNGTSERAVKSKYVELNTDLDLSEITFDTPWQDFDTFTGTFNGNGHTIKNFTLESNETSSSVGFFSSLRNAVIKDVVFDNAFAECEITAGLVAGLATNTQFIDCDVKNSTVKVAFDGLNTALYASSSSNCTFTNCDIENSSVIGAYTGGLFTNDYEGTDNYKGCNATDYTIMSISCVSDNQGFSLDYMANSYDSTPVITLTDKECKIEELIGEIQSVTNSGKEVTKVDGAYYIDRNNGPMCPEITFLDCKFTGVVYDIDLQTREITIRGYVGVDSNIVIPDVMYGHPVVAFEDYFKLWGPSESDITSISLPGSIKSVPSGLFCWYDNLESVTISEGVEEIGDYLFEECRKLTDINLPNSLSSIGEYAFFNCGADSVVLGENIEFIGDYALGYQLVGEEAVPIEGFTISGYAGTAAERYAQANGFKFIDLSA